MICSFIILYVSTPTRLILFSKVEEIHDYTLFENNDISFHTISIYSLIPFNITLSHFRWHFISLY